MQSPKTIELQIRTARSLADFLFLRSLRNRVRMQMTNNTATVGYWQQLRFYWSRPGHIEIYIALAGRARAGYLLLRRTDTTTMITEAVEPRYRGQGVATRLVRHAQALCADITADILCSNTASIRLHEATGFKVAKEDARIRTYRYQRQDAVPPR